MKITLKELTVEEVAKGYTDNEEEGVIGYDGKLNIRPKYQREFIYGEKDRNAVIETIRKGFPLNDMYCADNNDGTFELLDGQQRTISFCQYVTNKFSMNIDGHNKMFDNLTETEQSQIRNYKLMVYSCEGDDKEKLDWFEIVNTVGKPLNNQELRNAVYTGTWLTDTKATFSKTNCVAYLLAKKYVEGSPIHQKILEKAISWI